MEPDDDGGNQSGAEQKRNNTARECVLGKIGGHARKQTGMTEMVFNFPAGGVCAGSGSGYRWIARSLRFALKRH